MSQPQPWERLPDESAQAYSAFRAYLEMPPRKRSIDKAAESIGAVRGTRGGRQGNRRAPSRVAEWSSQHRWTERVKAWDAHVDEEDLADLLDDIKAWRKTKRRFSGVLVGKMAGALQHVNFDEQKASEAIRNWRVVAAIRDQALGIDAENQPGQGSSSPVPAFPSPEDLDPRRFKLSPEMLAATCLALANYEHKPEPEESAVEPELPTEVPAAENTTEQAGGQNES
jgi:hypothetical protein